MSSRPAIVQGFVDQLHALLPGIRITRVRTLGLLWAEPVSLPRIAADLPGAAVGPIWRALLPTLLAQVATGKVILVFDPTPFTTRATILVLDLVHGHRILPLAWRTVPQQDGPWDIYQHTLMGDLMAEAAAVLPADCAVTLVVDRQMGGTAVLDAAQAIGWHVVARIKAPRSQPVYWRSGPEAPAQPV